MFIRFIDDFLPIGLLVKYFIVIDWLPDMLDFVILQLFDETVNVFRDLMIDDEKGISDVYTGFSAIPVLGFEMFH